MISQSEKNCTDSEKGDCIICIIEYNTKQGGIFGFSSGGLDMIIKIDVSGEIPIYVQLRNEIVKGIGRGEFADGEALPTVRQLASELGVNTMTVSKAYQSLKAEGFIETDRRRGAVVRLPDRGGSCDDRAFCEKLEGELELLSAEAKIKGFQKEDFIRLCDAAFEW